MKSQHFKPPIEKVIDDFLPRINHLANKYAYLGQPVLSKEDLVSAGVIGLIEAYHRFDPSKKVNFRTYAEYRIKGAILDEIRKIDIIPRSVREKTSELEEKVRELYLKLGRMPEEEEVAESLGISLEEYQKLLENIKGISFIDIDAFKQKIPELEEEDIFEFLAGASSQNDPIENYTLKELTEKLAEAMEVLSEKERLILALYYYEDLNMKEIARVLGYTEGRISQLHQQALIKLRTYLNIKF
ncbi:RNA polymerase sigma factor [Caldimicrobium thiodismutans]|uniref:RNA polymerase sigma factor n=1 Tax=Caldimicrobium thiodismutans TaxID=1653476 RepID=A0A0U5AKY8_9BACT|nr:FliA/WhiG family RNA polymerase sigma factor [Caldimicrobium thiodismutans]BAU22756.1 RNA polymerase sigma factor [Caldimicrobium thiodismutans]